MSEAERRAFDRGLEAGRAGNRTLHDEIRELTSELEGARLAAAGENQLRLEAESKKRRLLADFVAMDMRAAELEYALAMFLADPVSQEARKSAEMLLGYKKGPAQGRPSEVKRRSRSDANHQTNRE